MTAGGGRGIRAGLTAICAGTALAACSHGGEVGSAPPATNAPAAPAMVQAISNDLQVGDVIDALNRGDVKSAHRKLKAMLKRDATDARAATLIESIDGDPKALLGEESFAYTLRPGDSFPELARRYLGNGDKFYALARYNDIAVPDAAKPGTVIRIPGTAPKAAPPPPRRTERPATRSEPAKPQPKPAPQPVKPSADPARAAKYRAAGLSALNGGKVDRAVALLSQAAALDPGNAVIKRDLARARRVQQVVRSRK